MLPYLYLLAELCIGYTKGYSDRSMVASPGDCCVEKMVDMKMYILSEILANDLAQAKGCASACSYRRLDDDGTRWCFGASGPLTVNSCTPRTHNEIPLSSTTETAESAGEVALLIGGMQSESPVYQVATYGSCNLTVNPFPNAILYHAAAVLDGLLYCCGGVIGLGNSANDNRNCYTLEKDYRWSLGPMMKRLRSHFTLNAVGTKLVALGGFSGGSNLVGSAEVLSKGKWEISSFVQIIPRAYHCTVTLSKTEIAVLGGVAVIDQSIDHRGVTATVERIDIETGVMSRLADVPILSYYYSCEVLENNIFAVDGESQKSYSLDYSSSLNSWIALPSMNIKRYFAQSAILNGNFAIFGGSLGDYSAQTYETFNDGVWTTAPMVKRDQFTVVVLPCN